MRAKAGEMPESLVLRIGNIPGVSDGRFGFDSFFSGLQEISDSRRATDGRVRFGVAKKR